jgi:hypothetical protein
VIGVGNSRGDGARRSVKDGAGSSKEDGASSRWRKVSREKNEEVLGMKCEGGRKTKSEKKE